MINQRVGYKSRSTAILLALFLGGIGAHKFYTNKPGVGIIYMLLCWTFLPSLFFSFIDIIVLLCMDDSEFDKKFNFRRNLR